MKPVPFDLNELQSLLREVVDPRPLLAGESGQQFLRDVRVLCHPDRYRGDPPTQQRADSLRKHAEALAEEAGRPAVVLGSRKHNYNLVRHVAVGDVSDVFLAVADGREYVVKVSRVKGGDTPLNSEANILREVISAATPHKYDAYLPAFCESFGFRDQFARRANVLLYQPGFVTLEQVHELRPSLDGRHLAWIFKRLLTAIGVANQKGYVHGAVCPSHVMIRPGDHALQLIGWGQAVRTGERLLAGSTAYMKYYPPEALNKKEVTGSLDVYMAAKTIIYAAGGDAAKNVVPPEVPRDLGIFLRGCLVEGQKMRPEDAWDLYDDLDEVLKKVYGPPKFVTLEL